MKLTADQVLVFRLDRGPRPDYKSGGEGESTCISKISALITCRAKLMNADWLRDRAFFLNQEGTFGNQEGMIT